MLFLAPEFRSRLFCHARRHGTGLFTHYSYRARTTSATLLPQLSSERISFASLMGLSHLATSLQCLFWSEYYNFAPQYHQLALAQRAARDLFLSW